MKKISTIDDVLCVLEKALKEYPGASPGLKPYRKKVKDSDEYVVTGYLWEGIPTRYVAALTDLTETNLRDIHQRDHNGNMYFEVKNGRTYMAITITGTFVYKDPDPEPDNDLEAVIEK